VGSVGALTGTCVHGGGHRSALMAGRDHEHANARTSWAGGVAADGVAEQRGHGKGRALSPSPLRRALVRRHLRLCSLPSPACQA